MTENPRYAFDSDEGFIVDMHHTDPENPELGTELLPSEIVDLLNALEQRVEQSDKDWLLMMQAISLFDRDTDWHNAGKNELLEQFDPWATLRSLKQQVEGLEKIIASERDCAECWKGEACGSDCHMLDVVALAEEEV